LLINYKPSSIDSSTKLNWNQNNLSIEFNGIWTKNPEKLSYRYQLKGYDIDWKYSSFSQMINYNNLDAGDYIFIVQSKNDEDIWSEAKEFKFSIALPLWKKWWFWLVTVSFIGFSVYWLIKWRIRALRNENLVLEEKVAQRTKEIEKQSEIIAEANKELEQLSIVASRTDNVVLILNPQGDIEYVNESFQKLNHITLKEILEKKLNIFNSSNNNRVRDFIDEAVAGRKSIKYESYNDKDPNNKVWEASTLTPIFDENDKLKKIIIIDSDITESKRQQRIIEQKHQEITDSINYAERIQRTFLATTELLNQNFKDYFVFFQPKDVVSGDFYWASKLSNGNFAFATADSTGHGVPGAIMSLLNITSLEKAIEHHLNPADILNHTRKTIIERLKRDGSQEGGKDGMDCSLISFDFKNKQIHIANANNPVWIVRGKEMIEIKPDKMPVGKHDKDSQPFTLKTVDVFQGDVVYALTDGFPDQFGGEKGKKFMIKNLKTLLLNNAHLPMQEQQKLLATTFKNWVGDYEQVDDVAVVGVRI
jgi:PAS domain S-box-containing protein